MKYIIFLLLISVSNFYFSQIRYYAQGFESLTNACPNNWTYSGGNRNNQHAKTGSYSARVGRSGESNTLTLNPVDISQLTNVSLRLSHSILSGSGPGMDTREGAVFLISLNGGAYSILSGVSGFGDHNYPWTASLGGTTSTSSGCTSFQTPNALIYSIPAGTTTVSIRVISVGRNSSSCSNFNNDMNAGTASNFDRTDEGIYIDDVEIWADGPNVLAPVTVCENEAFSVGVTNTNSAMTYNWSGPNSFTSTLQNPQVTTAATTSMSGTYSTIISFTSCPIVTLNQSVNVSAGPNLSISGSLSFCTGTSTTLSASGGINYQWSNGLGNNSTAQITAAGTYTITASGSGTCTTQETITVNETSSIINNTTISECFSFTWPVNNQTYSASGNYSVVNGCVTENLNLTITGITQNTTNLTVCDSYTWPLSGLTYTSSGTYFTTVGCQTELLNLTITPSSTNTTTINACDSFTWPVNNQTYTTSGNYTFINGCVTESLNLTISNSVSNTTTITECSSYTWPINNQVYTSSGTYSVVNGCVTEILVLTITGLTQNSTNQTACDSYTWIENGITYFNSGTYIVVSGCTTELLNLTITTGNTNTTTVSACNSYTWSQNNITYTSSGTYTFLSGCNTEILVLTINSNPILSFNNPTVCQGQAATLTVTSNQVGTTFLWSNGQTTANIVASPNVTTSYNVLGTNQSGCFTTGIGMINVTPSPQLIFQDTSVCLGQSTTITVSPVTNGGTYLWNTGSTSSSINVSPTQNTSYTVQYTLNACQSALATINVVVSPPFVLSANNPTICLGTVATITPTSSSSGGVFTWSDGSNNSTANFSPSTDTIVTFSYTLNGCTSSGAASITVLELPTFSFTSSQSEGCAPLNIDFNTSFLESTQCTWQINGQTVSSNCGNLNYTFYNPNCYDVSLSVLGTNGCTNTINYTDIVCVYPNPVANFYFDEYANYQTSATVGFTNTSQNSLQNWWNFGDGNYASNENTPIHTFFFENDASYDVELVVESEYGCRDSVIKTVSFNEELNVYIPNSFTPDGSGFNEVWKPIFSTIVDQGSYECFVFNRFGEQVFFSQNFNEGWDGSFNNNKVQDGTYSYYIEFSEVGVAKSTVITGHITILR